MRTTVPNGKGVVLRSWPGGLPYNVEADNFEPSTLPYLWQEALCPYASCEEVEALSDGKWDNNPHISITPTIATSLK